MKKYIDELAKRIDELIKIYEQYLWKDEDSNLIVSFQDNMIMFNLCEDNEIIDEIYLSFEDKERKFYEAICLRTFALLLGNVRVYKDDIANDYTMYYNESRKPYFAVISNDNNILSLINSLVDCQETEVISNNQIIMKANKKVSRYLPNIPVLNSFDNRIYITKEMLRKKQ